MKGKQTIVFILFLVFLILGYFAPQLVSADLLVTQSIQSIASPQVASLLLWVSQLGDRHLLEPLILLTSIYLFKKSLIDQAILNILGPLFGFLSGAVAKSIFQRSRPVGESIAVYRPFDDYSYPSLHVVTYTIFFGYLFYVLLKHIKIAASRTVIMLFCLFMIAAVSVSRIYLGAHWFTDTLGGYLFAFVFLSFQIMIDHHLKTNER